MDVIMKKKNTILAGIVLFAILLFAFFLRAQPFLSGHSLFLPDQARDLLLVQNMVEDKKPPMIGARAMSGGYIFHGPFWIWILSVPFVLFQGDPLAISYVYVLISVSIIAFSFAAAYKLFGLKVATLTALFLTCSYTLINNVSGTTNAQLMPLVFVGYLYCLITYLRGNKKLFFFALFFAGLGIQFQGIFAVPLVLYLLLVSLFTDRYILNIKRIILSGFIFMIPLATFVLFDVRHKFLIAQGLFRLLTDQKGLGVIPGYEDYGNIGFRVTDRFFALLDTPYSIMYGTHQMLYVLFVASLIVAGVLLFRQKNMAQERKVFSVLLLLPVFVYTLYIYFSYPIWEHYVFSIPVVIAFIFGIALDKISQNTYGRVIVVAIAVITLIPLVQKLKMDYFTAGQTYAVSDGSYATQLAVADYIFTDANGEEFGYFVYSPQVFTYGMDYLLWWRGKNVYGYIPKSEKLKTFYLVMYPPLTGDENAHAFWMKNVLKTNADVVSTKTFPGGIIVQKRMLETVEEPVDPNYYLIVR
jgi:hypothetical protein